jgi:hypothetical protein
MEPNEKSRWQEEFDALPKWAQQLVRGLQNSGGWGFGGDKSELTCGMRSVDRERFNAFHALIERNLMPEFLEGYEGALELAQALTAPWPPPKAPMIGKQQINVVELATSGADYDCAFDQPCCFGHRVEDHAVYCHNEGWPDSPRKCRRNRTDYRHEDCPGFVANPEYSDGNRGDP